MAEAGGGLNRWLVLVGFLVITFAASAIGGWFTSMSVSTWYQEIAKPSFTPPSWVFGPVWTTLYALMAVAAWLVWDRVGFTVGAVALTLYAVQLVLNVAWSGLFFGLRSPALGTLCVIILWIAILATIIAFWRIYPVSGVLLIPYIVWVSYASALTYSVWRLNA